MGRDVPTVEVVERLNIAPRVAWDRIERVAEFPTFMESVQTVEVLEERALPGDRTEVVTAWEVELDGCLLRWVEREVRSPSEWRIDFTQVQGDLSRYEGYWHIRPRDDSVQIGRASCRERV